jgi:shikimate kinase
VLVGLMGAGKSSIGRLLSRHLGLEFVDADAEIEAAAGASIEEIFKEHGEAAFRSGERRVIARLLAGPVRVIATGGGAFMNEATRAAIKKSATSVWLKADLETLLKRVTRRGGRPLLKDNDPRMVLQQLVAERGPVYGKADITVETSENPPADVADRVIKALEAHLGITALVVPRIRPCGGSKGGARNGPKGAKAGAPRAKKPRNRGPGHRTRRPRRRSPIRPTNP